MNFLELINFDSGRKCVAMVTAYYGKNGGKILRRELLPQFFTNSHEIWHRCLPWGVDVQDTFFWQWPKVCCHSNGILWPERQNPPTIVKGWCSGTDFWKFVKMICSGTEIQGWKWGSLARHIPNMHTYGSTPPPPPGLQLTPSMQPLKWL